MALVSSHAPWTPIAEPIDDWTAVGDGRVFERWAGNGEPPAVVWSDTAKLRAYYARSLDYSLAVLQGFAERYVGGRTLLLILGDHQPAGRVTGPDAGREVPFHVLSADPALVAPFLDWGLTPGMTPGPTAASHPMEAVRDRLVRAFSPAAAPVAASRG